VPTSQDESLQVLFSYLLSSFYPLRLDDWNRCVEGRRVAVCTPSAASALTPLYPLRIYYSISLRPSLPVPSVPLSPRKSMRGRVTGVLLALQTVFLQEPFPSELVQESIGPFIAARCLSPYCSFLLEKCFFLNLDQCFLFLSQPCLCLIYLLSAAIFLNAHCLAF
jgi:hypothetical protein